MRKPFVVAIVVSAVLMLAGFLVIGWFWINADSEATRSVASGDELGTTGCTDSGKLVAIEIAPTGDAVQPLRLEMPANYFGHSTNWSGGAQQYVRINAEFPSLRARPTGTFWSTCGEDALRKQSKNARLSDWPEDELRIEIGTGVFPFRDSLEEYAEAPSGVEGLKHMRLQRDCLNQKTLEARMSCRRGDMYFPVDAAPGQAESFECLGVLENPSASCNGIVVFDGHIVRFSFKRNQLPRWRELYAGVIALMTRHAR